MKTVVILVLMGTCLLMGCSQPHNVATSSTDVEARIKPVGEVTMAPSSATSSVTPAGDMAVHAATQGNSSR